MQHWVKEKQKKNRHQMEVEDYDKTGKRTH